MGIEDVRTLADAAVRAYQEYDSSSALARSRAVGSARRFVGDNPSGSVERGVEVVLRGDNVDEQALLLRASAQAMSAAAALTMGAKTAFGHVQRYSLDGPEAAVESAQVIFGMLSEIMMTAIRVNRRPAWVADIIPSMGVQLPELETGPALFAQARQPAIVDDFINSIRDE